MQIIEITSVLNKVLNLNAAFDGSNIIYIAGANIVFVRVGLFSIMCFKIPSILSKEPRLMKLWVLHAIKWCKYQLLCLLGRTIWVAINASFSSTIKTSNLWLYNSTKILSWKTWFLLRRRRYVCYARIILKVHTWFWWFLACAN